jgi:hypothetical protein
MAHTYHDLKVMTVAQLREIAKEAELKGYTQMNKDHLLPAICEKLGIDTFEHHHAVGIDKPALKKRIRELKQERNAALEAHDHAKLKNVRRQLHRINRDIRRHLD